jgi:hypothetical protein
MFGRKKKHAGATETPVPVDAGLESDIALVAQSVTGYLADPTEATRQSLVGALQVLDDRTEQSDAYGSSAIGSGAFGYSSKGEVLGETGLDPVVDEVPTTELTAQLALVNAAKDEVRGPTPGTFASLQAANVALAEANNRGTSGS